MTEMYKKSLEYKPITRYKLKSGHIVRVIEGPEGIQLFIKKKSLTNGDIIIARELKEGNSGLGLPKKVNDFD
ncbi:hypothetical protein [Pseudoalteromonas sp.]|uniref:hypothetical protein n=1 Tax=Pseudoalteromonas sp. TaxID=53249 RepID=UPI00262ED55D|nr:hypothetical protein [Pseudoalteromonas sp.]MCP4585335.1 hypothetical protein [Pseudoalteromonas sp.]